jgi:hypothetical protein
VLAKVAIPHTARCDIHAGMFCAYKLAYAPMTLLKVFPAAGLSLYALGKSDVRKFTFAIYTDFRRRRNVPQRFLANFSVVDGSTYHNSLVLCYERKI